MGNRLAGTPRLTGGYCLQAVQIRRASFRFPLLRMKTSILVGALLVSSLTGLQADQTTTAAGQSAQAITLPTPTAFRVVDIGANHRVWQRETYEAGPGGQIMTHIHTYNELASGMNYQDANSQWQESKELIEAFPNGAVARQGQYQVIFADNLNSAGSIDMQTTDGKRLRSNILGLMYVDTSTGDAALIAGIQDSAGELISSNQVLYPDAFEGLKADVQYTYKRGSFEQDVILREQPPLPDVFGMNPDTTELEVMTEFIDPPEAKVSDVGSSEPGLESDQAVSWGATQLGSGKAFNLGDQGTPATVSKRYVNLNGRHFLLEKIMLRDIESSLSKLPEQSSNQKPLPGLASKNPVLPKTPPVKIAGRPIHMASTTPPNQGYVLDYVSLNPAYTNYVFQRDTTYYLSGPLALTGTNTFEGGTVIKYAAGATMYTFSQVIFDAGLYHPVVFTAKDDNTVGENISGSTGSPSGYYASPALAMPTTSLRQFSGLRVSYAKIGFTCDSGSASFYNAQFVNCQNGFYLGGLSLSIGNALFVNNQTNFISQGSSTINAQNCTFSGFNFLATAPTAPNGSAIALTNCVFANGTNLVSGSFITTNGGYNGFYKSPPFGAAVITNTFYPFQPTGAGACYLTNGCAFLNAGTANADTNDLALLPTRTTYPPLVISNISISTVTNYSPYVARDTNSSPDLGYHYDPFDYVFGGVNVYSNMTFTAGTAVGYFELPGSGGPGYGISIYDKVILSLNGTASQPCTVARYSTVQEGSTSLWKDKGYLAGIIVQSLSGGYSMNPTNAAQIWPTFTRHYVLTQDSNHYRENSALTWVAANNSEFYGGGIGTYWVYSAFTNCLFDRTGTGNAGGNTARYAMRNCTVHGGTVNIYKAGLTWPVWIEDSAFDKTTLSVEDNSSGNTNITYCDFNAFVINTNRLPMLGAHDVIVTNYNWQSSWLGNYYLPSNSSLTNAGSLTADQFGLYHFTTQTDQTKETNSVVDIGYHYVAADDYGHPLDSNGNGIPDYLEDANGNGLVDNGEPSWMAVPMISMSPVSQSVVRSSNISFTVSASGVGPLSYQWFQNGFALTDDGSHIAGSTSPVLTILNSRDTDATFYQVAASNPAGSTYSSIVTLTVLDPPVITTQPANQFVTAEQTSTFSVVADGALPLAYQWRLSGTNLPAATNAILIINNAQTNNAGNYSVVVTNVAGCVTSSVASLTVQLPPVSWLQQYYGTNYAGNTNYIATADPDGDGTNNLQEYYNGSDPTDYYNGTLPTLTVINGNNQSGGLNAFISQPLQIRVTKASVAMTNAPVAFIVTNGIGQIAITNTGAALSTNLSLRTDTNGYATIWFFLPSNAPATNNVIVTAQSSTNVTQINFNEFGNTPATPIITPNGGSFAVAQNITITCVTTGAVVHYTLNGATPTESDTTVTNGQIIKISGATASTTVKAVAFEDGVLSPSSMQAAVFNVTGTIAAGYYHTVALRYDGLIFAAGTNNSGQLGNGTTNSSAVMVLATTNYWPYFAVAAGYGHSIGLLNYYDYGLVYDWGLNNNGQLGNNTTTNQTSYVRVILSLPVTNLTATAIAAGASNSFALLSDGSVRAWGDNSQGQLGDGTTTDRKTNVVVTGLSNVVAVATGGYHSLALQSNGIVKAWGLNSNGELGDGTTTSPRLVPVTVTNLTSVTGISAGAIFSLALLSNSTVRAWGDNNLGELGDGTTTDRKTNVVVTGLSNVVAIAAGRYHSLALLSDGTVRSWGTNNFGQLGDGTTNKFRLTSVAVTNLSNVVAIAAGAAHSVALKSDGTIVVWGYTNYGLPGGFSSTPVTMQPTNHLINWTAPSILTQPTDQTGTYGQSATFNVLAGGVQPLSYQWYSNSVAVADATNAWLTLGNLGADATGSFSVVITNSLGTVTSRVAELSVYTPLTIVSQPTNTVVAAGSTATFSVAAIGSDQPLYYQWLKDGYNSIPNATNSTLVLSNTQTNQAGQYWVSVWTSVYDGPSVSSVNAALSVVDPLTIYTQPTSQMVPLGGIARLSVTASGPGSLSYQWYFNTAPVNGGTNATLAVNNLQSYNVGNYYVVISNAISSITSSVATLTANLPAGTPQPSGLVDWWQAENNAIDVAGSLNGTVYGNGVSYANGKVGQAFNFDGSYGLISFGSTAGNFGTNDFTIEFWMSSAAGDFSEYPILEKLAICGLTNEFTIRLEGRGFNNPKPGTLVADISQSASSHVSIQSARTVTDGLFHHVAVVRQTTNLLLYIDGYFETNSSSTGIINITNSASLIAGSSPCIGTDGTSSYFAGVLDEISIYNRALLASEITTICNAGSAGKFSTPPYFITQPTNQQTFVGSNVTFSVVAGGNAPLHYQWYAFKTGLLANATNTTLTLSNVQTNTSDSYYVVITNNFGSAAASASLIVIDPAIDADGNGLPDWWENYYFGHTGVNPNADLDGDGWTNMQEYQNGTNPNSADAPFAIQVTQPSKYLAIP